MTKPDGGPAFPTLGDEFIQTPGGGMSPKSAYGFEGNPGMTLRDWFAGQALAGQLGGVCANYWPGEETLAKGAYEIADAMLAERAKT
jgi:hypothetical protein